MTWNHRLIKREYEGGHIEYGVYEVYYNDDGSIYAYTVEPVAPCAEKPEEVKELLEWMLNCLDKPVLVYDQIETHDPSGVDDKIDEAIEEFEKTGDAEKLAEDLENI